MDEKDLEIQKLKEELKMAKFDIRLLMMTGLPCAVCNKADGDCDRRVGCTPEWRGEHGQIR